MFLVGLLAPLTNGCLRATNRQGLDSSSASEVMLLAKKLACPQDRRAVVASVHQPSPEMFALFDKVRLDWPREEAGIAGETPIGRG